MKIVLQDGPFDGGVMDVKFTHIHYLITLAEEGEDGQGKKVAYQLYNLDGKGRLVYVWVGSMKPEEVLALPVSESESSTIRAINRRGK